MKKGVWEMFKASVRRCFDGNNAGDAIRRIEIDQTIEDVEQMIGQEVSV